MKKRVTLAEVRSIVRRLIEDVLDDEIADEMNTLQVGDVVDTMGDEFGDFTGVHVVELVDDVNAVAGPRGEPGGEGADFHGPGFIGLTPEGDEVVFALSQVVPDSKLKGYFPKLGDEFDEDEYGRRVQNPYRKMAKKMMPRGFADVTEGDHADPTGKAWDSGLDEADEDHEGDPRWDDHADPTGKTWDAGLDEAASKKSFVIAIDPLKKPGLYVKGFASWGGGRIESGPLSQAKVWKTLDGATMWFNGHVNMGVFTLDDKHAKVVTWDEAFAAEMARART